MNPSPRPRYFDHTDLNVEASLRDFLNDRCRRYANKIAVIDARLNVQWTYSMLAARVAQLRAFLIRNGVMPGCHVAINSFNGVETYASILAVACLPAIAVLVRPSFKYREVKSVLTLSQCSVVITDADHLDTIRRIQEELSVIKSIFLIGDEIVPYPSITKLFREPLPSNGADQANLNGYTDQDLSGTTVLMVPTSGTTGRPKIVEHTTRSYLSSVHIGVPFVNTFHEDDVFVTWASLTHVTGIWKLGGCLHVGATLVVARFDKLPTYNDVHTICEQYKVTSFMIFPTMSRIILMNASGQPTTSVTSIICGGSRATPGLENLMRRWFPNLRQLRNLLGQTEAMIYVSITPTDEFDLRSIGYPPSNCELRLVDPETGEEVAFGEIGEIILKSPATMKGYFQNPCETSAAFTEEGWLKTGDLAYQDAVTGRFFYVDRIKEMIFCKDNRIYPSEIENVLMEHICVAEAAVIGVPHPAIGEAPAALVELKPGARPSEHLRQELAGLVESQLASFKVLYGGVHFVERLPRTELNKVARRKLRELLPAITYP